MTTAKIVSAVAFSRAPLRPILNSAVVSWFVVTGLLGVFVWCTVLGCTVRGTVGVGVFVFCTVEGVRCASVCEWACVCSTAARSSASSVGKRSSAAASASSTAMSRAATIGADGASANGDGGDDGAVVEAVAPQGAGVGAFAALENGFDLGGGSSRFATEEELEASLRTIREENQQDSLLPLHTQVWRGLGRRGWHTVSCLELSVRTAAALCSQVYSWGRGEHGVLGVGSDQNHPLPTPVLFSAELGLVRVKAVACSWFHTVGRTCGRVWDVLGLPSTRWHASVG